MNAIEKCCKTKSNRNYYKSEENTLRSLNIYYSYHVMGKQKYINIRKANKTCDLPNFVSYKTLSEMIRSIDIGPIHNIHPTLTSGCNESEIECDGMYRNLIDFAPRLAKFYLTVNEKREDKLETFPEHPRKDPDSHLFLMAIGGDEAPGTGTSFLLSFLNVGLRIASSFENFLLFGSNAKENGFIVRQYVSTLLADIKLLECKIFEVTVGSKIVKAEFKLQALPNDMKMLCFLSGELSNSARYFTTFANVTKFDSNDIRKHFDMNAESADWHPFKYEKRVQDAKRVAIKKSELKNKNVKPSTLRTNITTFISNVLHSRQEEIPLLEQYIDLARCEPLHLKNNVVKELFMKVLRVVLAQVNFTGITSFRNLHGENLFVNFIDFVKVDMNCNHLAKKNHCLV